MSKDKRHKGLTLNDYRRYLADQLSENERHDLEKEMLRDRFDQEASDGLLNLSVIEFNSDLADLKTKLNQRSEKRSIIKFWPYFSAAASVIIIIGLFFIFRGEEKFSNKEKLAIEATSESLANSKMDTMQYHLRMERKRLESPKTGLVKNFAEIKKQAGSGQPSKVEENDKKTSDTIRMYAQNEENAIDNGSSIMKEIEIKAEEIQPESTTFVFVEALSGRASGVEVKQYSAQPAENNPIILDNKNSDLYLNDSGQVQNFYTIRGRILDELNNQPIPGANIIVDGTKEGAVSDLNGEFTLKVPAKQEQSLDLSFLGYEKEKLTVTSDTNLLVMLEPSANHLDEVVVIGYGVQKKSDMTGAVSNIEMEDHINTPVSIVKPLPLGGYKNFRQYIKDNKKCDKLTSGCSGQKVKLKFLVNIDGKIKNIEVLKSPAKEYSDEAIRLLKKGPGWNAGTSNGAKTEMEVKYTIVF